MDVHEILASEQIPGLVYLAVRRSLLPQFRPRRSLGKNFARPTIRHIRAEDRNGVVYVGCAKGRPNHWIREEGAIAAIFRSRDKGTTWEKIVDNLKGGVMHMCPTPDGNAGRRHFERIVADN